MENYTILYKYKQNEWQEVNRHCTMCGRTLRKNESKTHREKCNKINTTEENNMPIQRIVQDGKIYYRWGDHGKMYTNRADAEKQAQAAYSAGYKEPKKDMTQK